MNMISNIIRWVKHYKSNKETKHCLEQGYRFIESLNLIVVIDQAIEPRVELLIVTSVLKAYKAGVIKEGDYVITHTWSDANKIHTAIGQLDAEQIAMKCRELNLTIAEAVNMAMVAQKDKVILGAIEPTWSTNKYA